MKGINLGDGKQLLLALVFLFPILGAGCFSPSIPGPCDGMVVPSAHGGDRYDYTASGTIGFEFTANGIQGGWEPATAHMTYLEEGRLSVEISSKTSMSLDMGGKLSEGFLAEYTANDPGSGNNKLFLEERIHTESGNLISSKKLHGDAHGPYYQDIFTRINRPPLLLAPFFWERPLAQGDTGTHDWPHTIGVPGYPQLHTLEYRVVETSMESAGCTATIWIDPGVYVYSRGESYRMVESMYLTFSESMPLPIDFKESYVRDARKDFRLILLERRPGEGDPLPPFRPTIYPNTELRLEQPVSGFLAGADGLFPTDYTEAHEVATQHPAAAEWLENRPAAQPLHVTHRMGDPGQDSIAPWGSSQNLERVVDLWSITWVDPQDGEPFSVHVYRIESIGQILAQRLEARIVTTTWDDDAVVPIDPPWVTLEELAQIHRQRFGQEPEVINCRLHKAQCNIGTHESTRFPYATLTGAGGAIDIFPGLVVWVNEGWILQDESYLPRPT
jgi:hypothetical protein